jgi:PAS domain S-box-containing protein
LLIRIAATLLDNMLSSPETFAITVGIPVAVLIAFASLCAVTLQLLRASRLQSRRLSESLNDLRVSTQRHRLLVDGVAGYAIFWLDTHGIIDSWNLGASKLTGYIEEEVLGKHFSMFYTDDDLAKKVPERALSLAVAMGEFRGEGFRIRKDGSQFWANAIIEPIHDAEGTNIGFAVISRDGTENKEQQEALKTSEETFRSAMEAASIGMALVQPGGRILKVNNALCALLGYDQTEIYTKNIQEVTHPDDLQRDRSHVRQVLSGEKHTYQLEKRYVHKNGRHIWALLNVSLVRSSKGEPQYFIAQIQDISVQKEMERMKTEFVSIVSHELRTPLTSVRGSLALIRSGVVGDMAPKVKALNEIAYNNTERLILLINDILDMNKIESGEMRFEMKDHELDTLISQAVESNQPYAEKFGVYFVVRPFLSPCLVNVDNNRFIQVLSNLLSNAAKFSNQGDDVTISTVRHGDKVRVSVIDHGPGITAEFRSRIFNKFAQADSSSTRQKGGTGLGLNISKQIIEHMRGDIGFVSEVGNGAEFWIELKEKRTQQLPDESMTADDLPSPNELSPLPTILHVEDDYGLYRMLQHALEGKAHVHFASSISEATKLLKRNDYQLVLLDLTLPDGSGLSVLEHVENEKLPVHVIILSASEVDQSVKNRVALALVKSRIAEDEAVDHILQVISASEPISAVAKTA